MRRETEIAKKIMTLASMSLRSVLADRVMHIYAQCVNIPNCKQYIDSTEYDMALYKLDLDSTV